MPSRAWPLVTALLLWLASAAAQSAELAGCRAVQPVGADGAVVVGVEDMALDRARARVLLSAYDRRAVAAALAAGTKPPVGGIHALPLSALGPGRVRVERLAVAELPPGGLRPHGIGLAGDRLAVVNRTVAGGRIEPVVDVFGLAERGLVHRRRFADPRLCRPNDVAWAAPERLLVSNDRGTCRGLGLWWERVANRPASFVMAFTGASVDIAATGLRFANGVAVPDWGPVVAATRGRRLEWLHGEGVALGFAPDNLTVDAAGLVWAAGPVRLWRYAAFRAGWLADPGPSGLARWRGGGEPAGHTVPADVLAGVTVALPVGERLLLGAAYDDHLALCPRPAR